MDNHLEEREINLWDMFWAICQKWRLILIVAIAGAAIAGGMSYLKNAREINTLEQPQMGLADLSEEEQSNVELYIECYETYHNQLLYNKESPLMQLDANGFYVGTLDYYIDNHFEVEYPVIAASNNAQVMIRSYQGALAGAEFEGKLQEELNIKEDQMTSYVMEQVDCSNAYGTQLDGINTSTNTSTSDVMRVSLYAKDKETCDKLIALVKAELEQKEADVIRQLGQHDMILVNEARNFVANNALLTYQKNNLDKLYTLNANLANAKKLLTDDGAIFVEQLLGDELEEAANGNNIDTVDLQKPDISKKGVVIGFAAGAFFVFASVALLYIINNRLLYEDDFEQIYGVKLLGRVESERKTKRVGFLDKWILRMRRIGLHHFEEADAVNMICTGIKLAARKECSDTVYVTGAGMTEGINELFDQMATKLKKEGITLKVGKSVLYYADALEDMVECGNVVLLEKAGESMYKEIQQELVICNQQGLCLFGAVVIE